eukprot:366391-Chlamydomonas_euryale.AAC.23
MRCPPKTACGPYVGIMKHVPAREGHSHTWRLGDEGCCCASRLMWGRLMKDGARAAGAPADETK